MKNRTKVSPPKWLLSTRSLSPLEIVDFDEARLISARQAHHRQRGAERKAVRIEAPVVIVNLAVENPHARVEVRDWMVGQEAREPCQASFRKAPQPGYV